LSVGAPPSPDEHIHTVQFYGDDGVLLHELNNYLGSALASGSSAVIIATSPHIDSLDRKLKTQGIDLAKTTTERRYIALEAAEVLSKFMVDGRPDPVRFSETIGVVISRAARASRDENRRVVAFGEMVALLWAEGNSEGAMQLEKLWNELTRAYSFALRCAYPIQGFSRQQMAEPLLRICAEHTGIVHDGVLSSYQSDVPVHEGRDDEIETFRLFVNAVQDYAIFLLDTAGRVKSWNAGAERIKGYKASEIIGTHFSAFYLDQDVRNGKPQ
jgi:PAS domain-containing protein